MSLIKSENTLSKPSNRQTSPRLTSKGKLNKSKGVLAKRSKMQNYLFNTQNEANKFNSPLSQFLKKHKDYRANKAKNQYSVELSDMGRDSSIEPNPFTQTVVLKPEEDLIFNVIKPKSKGRSKYLTKKSTSKKPKKYDILDHNYYIGWIEGIIIKIVWRLS